MVMVMADGFAWNGQTYDSLSKSHEATEETAAEIDAIKVLHIGATAVASRLRPEACRACCSCHHRYAGSRCHHPVLRSALSATA